MMNSNPIDSLIGSRLRLRRIQLGLDLAAFASTLRVSMDRLRAFEAGSERISAQLMREMCEALDVNVRYFFEDPVLQRAGDKDLSRAVRLFH